jgi:N-6 DNA Methylase
LRELFSRLVRRNDRRTEAEIQADVRQFILSAPFELEEADLSIVSLESPVGERRRIDVEVGSTVIEVKRDLRREKPRREAEGQLGSYVKLRMAQTGVRYVGVLTDGTEWVCCDVMAGELRYVSSVVLEDVPADIERLIVWLEGVLATATGIAPTAGNIEARLGANSSSYALDRASLSTLYDLHGTAPAVRMKRLLWSRLLTSALGTQFEDTDSLFLEHTLLVNTADIIAHAVLGLSIGSVSPSSLLAGDKFDEAGIHGVVESDFFDWVVEVEGGELFIRTLAKRLARFEWAAVNQDVLKILYESIIGRDTRKRLGEYYTPDWLADVMVREVITDPLNTRVLDPACGSGTFLFHAIRRLLSAADGKGFEIGDLISRVTRQIIGMDLHPVAVTLARVTYLLAIGRDRLTNPARGEIQIPVYLGDSVQWHEQNADLWAAGNLVIRADDKRELFDSELSFPDALLEDAGTFDQLINEMADKASHRKPHSPVPSLSAVFARLAIPGQHRPMIERTFNTMCQLHDEGRDHIWGYYVRNLARPLWLSREKNRVDIVIGNPPWLAYRHMTPDMQKTFRLMSDARGLWAGAEIATHQDLSALFCVRACELYLRKGGRFSLVLPNAAIDRPHYEGFRAGHYGGKSGVLDLYFDPPWDLRRVRPHFFPRAASVVFGTRVEFDIQKMAGDAGWPGREMPSEAQIWTGRVGSPYASWTEASGWFTRKSGVVRRVGQLDKSPYAPAFTQGATFTPRFIFVVEKREAGSLGLPSGKVAVQSSRSVQEKKPWKDLPDLTGVVESEFVRPFYSGDNMFPFRAGPPQLAIIPCNKSGLLNDARIEMNPGLHQWWDKAQSLWNKHRSSDRLTLAERLDYQSTLSKQLPIPALRVVYNRAGMHLAAAKISDRRALIANGLYWAAVNSVEEADYLCAVINAPVTTELVRPFMSYGKDERDIHKHIWEVPIPLFNANDAVHKRLAQLGKIAEGIAAEFELDSTVHFAASRRHIRELFEQRQEGQEINDLVFELIE